ncbi:hypothetical protein TNCV_1891721, partial [Trichonephila clavipes]
MEDIETRQNYAVALGLELATVFTKGPISCNGTSDMSTLTVRWQAQFPRQLTASKSTERGRLRPIVEYWFVQTEVILHHVSLLWAGLSVRSQRLEGHFYKLQNSRSSSIAIDGWTAKTFWGDCFKILAVITYGKFKIGYQYP